MAIEKPLLGDIFNCGGTTPDGVSYDGWTDDPQDEQTPPETKDMSTLNTNAGATLGPDSTPQSPPPKFAPMDAKRFRAKRKDLKPPTFTPRN